MHDDRAGDSLDALIDRTARSITAGTPPARLVASVRSRIDAGARSQPHPWRMAIAAVALVLALGLAGRVWLDGRNDLVVPVRAPRPDASATTAPAAPRPAEPASREAVDAAEAAARRRTPVTVLPVVATSAATGQVVEEVVALEPIEPAPLDDRPVDDSPVEFELMEVPMPLRAEWVEIEPLAIQ